MARIQIMHLPAPADDYPFAVVIDDVKGTDAQAFQEGLRTAKDDLGARAILVFSELVEVI